jgi:hypothetical protein
MATAPQFACTGTLCRTACNAGERMYRQTPCHALATATLDCSGGSCGCGLSISTTPVNAPDKVSTSDFDTLYSVESTDSLPASPVVASSSSGVPAPAAALPRPWAGGVLCMPRAAATLLKIPPSGLSSATAAGLAASPRTAADARRASASNTPSRPETTVGRRLVEDARGEGVGGGEREGRGGEGSDSDPERESLRLRPRPGRISRGEVVFRPRLSECDDPWELDRISFMTVTRANLRGCKTLPHTPSSQPHMPTLNDYVTMALQTLDARGWWGSASRSTTWVYKERTLRNVMHKHPALLPAPP